MNEFPLCFARRPSSRRRLTVLGLFGILATAFPLAVPAPPQSATARAQPAQTALDRYVAAPDSNFTWKVVRELPAEGVNATLVEMTSQQWLTDKEVERPLWTHWITIVRPAKITSDIGLLFIGGGSNERPAPVRPPAWLVDAARETGTVTAELRLIPNQPVIFKDDPSRKPRSEDDFIAYTWDKFLRTGDEKWPARLPMTKSAVRAMDALTAFTATPEGGGKPVTRFVVSGASKRGWTTWTTAATDRRVVAIAPAVIDMLNVEPSFVHHWRAYGAWSDAVDDYAQQGIMDWMGTPEFRALMKIEEPYEYRDRLTMPKFMLNASGDQFFLPDSSRFYFDDLRGEKYLRYVPNTSHSLDKTDALESLQAFYSTIVKGTPRPQFSWTFERDGSIKVVAKDRPDEVLVWQAVNPTARNFRHDVIGSAYRSTPLTPSGPNTYVARVPASRAEAKSEGGASRAEAKSEGGASRAEAKGEGGPAGWTAFFVELKFPSGGKYPLKFTTAVRVLPDTLPFGPPPRRTPTGGASARAKGAAALAGLTIVAVHAGSQAPQQAPPPGVPAPGAKPAPPGGRQGRGAAVFPAQQRPPGDPAVIERGRTLYSVTCSACHGADARGGQLGGPNLLRSQLVLADQDGEAIVAVIQGGRPDKGMPPMPINSADAKAVATFLHSLLAAAGRQGSPPPVDTPPPDVLVGDATAGQTYFAAKCTTCHSATGDLQGIASRAADAKTLQNLWVSGGVAAGRGGRGGRGRGSSASAVTVTVTLPSGEKSEGQLRRLDDFIVTLLQADGTERSFRRDGDRPRVDIRDPLQGHRDLLAVYTEKDMHDVTAYLVTLK